MLAMIVGFLAVLVLAGGCYLAAWLALAWPIPNWPDAQQLRQCAMNAFS